MHIFDFIRPPDQAAAIASAARSKTAQQGADVRFMGGGTTLIDLMKLNVETPKRVLDINRLHWTKIESVADGGLKIGATVRNSDLANHAKVQQIIRFCRSDPERSIAADTQHGHCRREPAATHTLRLFSATTAVAATNASLEVGVRLSRATSHARYYGNERALHCDEPSECAWRWPRSRQQFIFRDQTDRAQWRSAISTFCPATHRTGKRCWSPAI